MKALSIKQPWASLICTPRNDNSFLGIKDIENRTWKTNFRGRVYIHASAKIAFVGSYRENLPHRFWIDLSESERSSLINSFQHRGSIIGEVDIIDCVINHSSIWAEKTRISTSWGENLPVIIDKPIYNWVLANPVLYEKPILNVKGKLSFWEPDIDIVECIGCSQKFDYETMQQDSAGENYCSECASEMFPVMRAEYQEMLRNGEIEE